MTDRKRPSAAEQADAADQVVEAIERAHHTLFEARKLIRTLHDDKHCLSIIDRDMLAWLERCDDPLWAARKLAVVEAYDERRKAKQEESADAQG